MRNTDTKVHPTMGIPFTQFSLPNGASTPVYTSDPAYTPEVLEKAQKILDAGFVFEIEVLTTRAISATIGDPVVEIDVAHSVSGNDAEVPAGIAAMILAFNIDDNLASRAAYEADTEEGTEDE